MQAGLAGVELANLGGDEMLRSLPGCPMLGRVGMLR